MNKLLVDRNRCKKELSDIYNSVSSHYLHFSDCDTVSEDVLEYIAKEGIDGELKSPSSFRSVMEAKLSDYFSGNPFAPSEVCCGIIYNSCMHLSGRPGETELVQRELGNNIIRHMIEASLKEFGWE